MRSFAGDEGVHSFLRRPLQFLARAAAHDADVPANLRSTRQQLDLAADGTPQSFDQVGARDPGVRPEAKALFFREKERAKLLQAQRGAEEGVVAEPGMRIEREVRTVNREVVVQQLAEQLVVRARPGMRPAPEQTVMDDQEVGARVDGEADRRQTRVHRGGDARDGASVLDLQSVDGAFVIVELARAQEAVAITDDFKQGERCHARNCRSWRRAFRVQNLGGGHAGGASCLNFDFQNFASRLLHSRNERL